MPGTAVYQTLLRGQQVLEHYVAGDRQICHLDSHEVYSMRDPYGPVADVMSREVVSIHKDTPVGRILGLFGQWTGMPVVDDQGAVVGNISGSDVQRHAVGKILVLQAGLCIASMPPVFLPGPDSRATNGPGMN